MRWISLSLLLLMVGGCHRVGPAKGALELSYWYWHTPYTLNRSEAATLRDLGVKRLFVRGGTFRNDGEKLIPDIPQRFEGPPEGFPVYLVYNFDAGAIAHLTRFKPADMAKAILDRFELDKLACESKRIEVQGIQLDIDSPTSRLPIYAELLKEVRARLGAGLGLSITALPTWFDSKELAQVVEQVDDYVPQFYEGSAARTVEDKTPLSDLDAVKKGMVAAERLGKPYFVGVPGYGRALLYDEKGKLLGTYGGLSAYDAARHPTFELKERRRVDGEDYYRFQATQGDAHGKGAGYSLVYRLPTPQLIVNHLREVEKLRGANCRGSIVFRIPEEGESTAVALPAVLAAMKGKDMQPKLSISSKTVASPWGRIEDPKAKSEPLKVTLTLKNEGNGGTEIGPNACRILLTIERGSVDALEKGGFDLVQPFRELADGSTAKSSLASANQIVFQRVHLAAGEKTTIGPLTLSPGTKLNCSYDLIAEASGDHVRGSQRIDLNVER